MCGRFALGIPKKRLEEVFSVPMPDDYSPRYNVAPGQEAVAVAARDGNISVRMLKWGLVPHWAKDTKIGFKMINARSETVFEKPAFREPVRSARCLIPAQAFYEWQRVDGRKQPFAISINDMDVFALAGLMAHWQDEATGEVVDSFTVLTCPPNELMAPIHDRMPVILKPDAWFNWLDPAIGEPDQLRTLFSPYPAQDMRAWPVGMVVNAVANDGEQLLERVVNSHPKQGSLL